MPGGLSKYHLRFERVKAMKTLWPRIVLSILVPILLLAGVGCLAGGELASDDVAGTAEAVTVHADPCGLWISTTPELAEARYQAAKTNPDMVQLVLPGGLSCASIIVAVPAVEDHYAITHGTGHAVVHYVRAPGAAVANEPDLAHTPIDIYLEGIGWAHWEDGIGTSPSDPNPEGMAKREQDPPQDEDLWARCAYWDNYVCELPNGLPALCRYCLCLELCHNEPSGGPPYCESICD